MTIRLKIILYAFGQFLNQIMKEAILILLCVAPVLCGVFFQYGVSFTQSLLTKYFDLPDLFTPYYLLFDLLLASITPLMYCFAAAYVILGEVDDGISRYLVVTPLGKSGYLISRLGLPTIIAFIISIAALYYFKLSDIAFVNIIIISLMTSLLGLVEALLVVTIAGNKVEGMAVSKLSGLFFLGLPAPFFISSKVQYLLFLLPSFWVSKYAMEQQLWYAVIGFLVTFGWMTLLYQRFKNKTVQ